MPLKKIVIVAEALQRYKGFAEMRMLGRLVHCRFVQAVAGGAADGDRLIPAVPVDRPGRSRRLLLKLPTAALQSCRGFA